MPCIMMQPQRLFLINLQEEKRRSFSRAQDILRFIFLYQKYSNKFGGSLMTVGYLWRVIVQILKKKGTCYSEMVEVEWYIQKRAS